MYTFALYSARPYLDPDKAIESGTYIGELTNIDAVAEELIATFTSWKDDDILEVVRGEKRNGRNSEIYTVGNWRHIEN